MAASAVVDGDADHYDEEAAVLLAGAGVFDGVGGQFAGEQDRVVLAGVIGKFLGDEAADFAEGLGVAGEPAGAGRRRRLEGVGSVQAHCDVPSRRAVHSQNELRDQYSKYRCSTTGNCYLECACRTMSTDSETCGAD